MKEVRIDIAEDEARYFGTALITFYDIAIPSAPVRLYLARKSTDTPYLGVDGWQASPAPLAVDIVSQSAGKTVVRAGPEICDRVPYSLFVRVQIEGSDVSGQAFWPEIMQSPKTYTPILGDFKSEPQITKHVAEPETQPVVAPPVFEPPPVVKTPEVETPVNPPKKSRSWVYLLLLLLIVGAGGIAYWQRDKIMPAGTEQAVTPASDQQAKPPTEALSAKFERLKKADPEGVELLALGEEAFSVGDRAIGQQAVALSVERGNEAAKLQRAKWYDPKTFASDRVEAMDANAAARAYFELALGGNTEATDLLKSICDASKSGGNNYRDFLDTTYCQGSLSP
jgi:hypothetical protein